MPKTCYACAVIASTVEHCPPLSFFPEGQRKNLITVPSCPDHNNTNSKDVEYTRNWLTTSWGVNSTAQDLFERKTKKSFDRSPRLFSQIFGTTLTVQYKGEVTGATKCDLRRCKTVFEACARALHYHNTREKHENWRIVIQSLTFDQSTPVLTIQRWTDLIGKLQAMDFSQIPTTNPEIFEYGVAHVEGKKTYYCFVFYGSFVVYALAL